MTRSFLVVALVGITLVSLPFDATAQASNPVRFGIAAGAAIPVSDLGNDYDLGYNGTVTIGLQPSMIPLGIRIDGAYNSFAAKSGTLGGDVHFTSVTGNLVYNVPSAGMAPYLIGGAGVYNFDQLGTGSANKFGWNIGGGIKLPLSGFDTFLEARYNQVQGELGSLKFIPITFGIMF